VEKVHQNTSILLFSLSLLVIFGCSAPVLHSCKRLSLRHTEGIDAQIGRKDGWIHKTEGHSGEILISAETTTLFY
jgi:hypothetical protein